MSDSKTTTDRQKPSRRRRILKGVGLGILALALLLALTLWFLLGTQAGARFLFTRLGSFIPGSLEVATLEGPIRGPLVVQGLEYDSEGMEVQIDRLALDWRLRALLEKRLDIADLEAQGVTVTLAEAEERNEEPSALPDVQLPLNIIVRNAQVRDMEIVTAKNDTGAEPAAEPLVINAIDLSTRAVGNAFEIENFAVESPDIEAQIAGRLEPVGDYPLDLTIDWLARLDDQVWEGSGALSGTLEELRVDHSLSAPIALELEALLRQPLRNLSFDARAEAPPFSLQALGADLPEGTVGGTVQAEGTAEDFTGRLDLATNLPDVGPLAVAGPIGRNGDTFTFDGLQLTATQGPTRIDLTGQVVVPPGSDGEGEGESGESPITFEAEAVWSEFVWPLTGDEGEEEVARSSAGRLEIAGTPEDWDLTLDGELVSAGLTASPLNLRGTGSTEEFRIQSLRAATLEGEMVIQGDVRWAPEVTWDLALDGRDLDPSPFLPTAGGDASGENSLALVARTSGRLDEAGPVGRVDPLNLSGTLRGQPVTGNGAVALAGERTAIEALSLTWGTLAARADGAVAPRLDLEYALEAPNLAQVVPEAAGSLTAEGRLSGPPETPRIEVSAEGAQLIWDTLSLAQLEIEGVVDLAPDGDLQVRIAGDRLLYDQRLFNRVALVGQGRRGDHSLDLEVDGDDGSGLESLRLAAQGGLDEATVWSGDLTTLDLALPAEGGSWSLTGPAGVVAGAERAKLESLCAASGSARLCLEGAWTAASGWQGEGDLTAVPLALLASLLPPDLEIDGTVGGELAASADAAGTLTAMAKLQPGAGTLTYPTAEGQRETLRFGEGILEASVDDAGVAGSLSLPLPDLGSAEGNLSLPGYRLAGAPAEDQPIAGRLQANITDLSFLQALTVDLDDTAGRFTSDLRLAGTYGRPRIGGEAVLADARAGVPALGITLTDLKLKASGSGSASDPAGQNLNIEGSARSGEGRVEISGVAPAVPGSEEPIRLDITGQRFQAMDTSDIEIFASPDLEVTYDGARLAITGEVTVPEATVEIGKLPPSAVAVSEDVVYVGGEEPVTVEDPAIPLTLSVRVILGDEVEIDALGLKAKPTGSLLLDERPGGETNATGEIDITGGTFKAYGQDLKIERGRLVFRGPVDDPYIDLRASRTAKDGTVAGLEATGQLDAPEITLWSDPPMNQSDQLSYILLGRPLDSASQSEGSLVTNAAASLGLKGGNLLAERLGARFGLEEARIETDGGLEEAQLVLGKFLSPRLYVAYGVGLFDAANTLRVRYLLSSKWTLEATTGVGTAGDLLYTIERGRGAKRRDPDPDFGEDDGEVLETRPVPATEGGR